MVVHRAHDGCAGAHYRASVGRYATGCFDAASANHSEAGGSGHGQPDDFRAQCTDWDRAGQHCPHRRRLDDFQLGTSGAADRRRWAAHRGSLHPGLDRVNGTQAVTDVDTGGQKTQKTDAVDPSAVLVLPNSFFGPFEAVAARLKTAGAGTEIPAYGGTTSFRIRVGESSSHQIQTTARLIAARRTAVTLLLPGALLDADPAQPSTAGARLPAVVLVGGSGPTDRDGLVFGIPVLGQIADGLADAGFVVLRYDKRGVGQSGGRAESAGLTDYAEDVRAAVKMLADRKDVDPKRIAVIGHSEGGAVALIAASKDKRIAAVALLASNGVPGTDLILAQQQHALDRLKLGDEERQAKVDLQKRIDEAVLTGKGWDQISPEVRRSDYIAEFLCIESY